MFGIIFHAFAMSRKWNSCYDQLNKYAYGSEPRCSLVITKHTWRLLATPFSVRQTLTFKQA